LNGQKGTANAGEVRKGGSQGAHKRKRRKGEKEKKAGTYPGI